MEQWRTELYHSGILGMKWGHRNGPPYPLTGAQRSGSEKKGGSPIAKAIRTLTDSGYRKRVAAAKKAQITRAKKKQHEEDRAKALKKGTASDVLKYRGEVSNKELQDAIDRIKLENQLEDLDRARLTRSQKYVDDFFGANGVGRVAGYAKNAATLVSSLSTIEKFVNGGNADAAAKDGGGKKGGKKSSSNSNSNSGGKKTEQKPNDPSVFGVPVKVVAESGAAVEAGKKLLDDEKLGDLWETYISSIDEDIKHSAIYSDELYHYGVKGMKWGKHLKRHNAESGDDIHGRPETDAQIGFKAGIRVGATQERLRQERSRVHQHASLTRNDQYSRRVTPAMEKSKERSARKTAIKKKVTTFIDRIKSLDLSRFKREGAPLLSYGIDYVTRLLHEKKKDSQEGRPNRQNNVGPKSFKHSYSDELYHYGVKGMKWGKHLKAHTPDSDNTQYGYDPQYDMYEREQASKYFTSGYNRELGKKIPYKTPYYSGDTSGKNWQGVDYNKPAGYRVDPEAVLYNAGSISRSMSDAARQWEQQKKAASEAAKREREARNRQLLEQSSIKYKFNTAVSTIFSSGKKALDRGSSFVSGLFKRLSHR